jgi:quercetin dioxygenase-like cupin family protein
MIASLIKSASPPFLHPEPGMTRQVLTHSPQLMLVRHYLDEGWIGAAHSHPHHQLIYVVRGRIRIVIAGEEFLACPGDSIVVDGGLEHQASALEASEVLDVFTPTREDYMP